MGNKIKSFMFSKKGINTVEVVIILAIMVGLAIIFRQQIGTFANSLMDSIFKNNNVNWGDMSQVTVSPSPASVP